MRGKLLFIHAWVGLVEVKGFEWPRKSEVK
jgi:hypothetical protein